jgi:hypothetical protein
MLHELGHAIGLGHIIDTHQGGTIGYVNPAKLMNFSVVYSVKRSSLDYSALAGSLYCLNQQGNSYGSCGLFSSEMTSLSSTVANRDNCPVSFPTTTTPTNTTLAFDLIHAGSNLYEDPIFTKISSDGTGRAVTNNAYYALKTGNLGGLLSISISSYTTTPASFSCPNYGSLPTKGIELALYEVSSCPSPASYPTPKATRIFDGNGPLTDISGLTANANYLLMVDGIENTKASFNMTFTGGALPTMLERFDGKSTVAYNDLKWSFTGEGMAGALLEKSVDGIAFKPILTIAAASLSKSTSFRDWESTPQGFYRLALKMADGTSSYSKTIFLKRELPSGLNIYPNPANSYCVVSYKDLGTGKMHLTIRNESGQLIQERSFQSDGSGTLQIDASSLKQGSYRISIYDNNGQPKSHNLLMIQK